MTAFLITVILFYIMNMNISRDSLVTLKQVSLLEPYAKSCQPTVAVYYDDNGKILETMLHVEGLTASAVILLAVEKFKKDVGLDLPCDSDQYELYVAKKSGKRKTDLPAIEAEQQVSKTGVKRFHLHNAFKLMPNLQTKQSLSSIKSQITMKKQKSPETLEMERGPGQSNSLFHCFCIRK